MQLRLPSLPATSTAATITPYFAIPESSYGPTWSVILPIGEWRDDFPNLPDANYLRLMCSDHSSGSGRIYRTYSDSITSGWSDPELVLTIANQGEMPVVLVNRRLKQIEIYPHKDTQSLYGIAREQDLIRYVTTDMETFTGGEFVLSEGASWIQHPGYGQAMELDNGIVMMVDGLVGAEHFSNTAYIRDQHNGPWKWTGKLQHINQMQLTGDETQCFAGMPRFFKWHGQWFRSGFLSTRPRLTFDGTESIVAYPVADDLETPINGYQTLVSGAASGFTLTGDHGIYADGGRLYVTYTEREDSSSENRIRVNYNSSNDNKPHPTTPATYTPPALELFEGGALWPKKCETTTFEHGKRSTTPDWAALTNESGTATLSQTEVGLRITSGANNGVWTWAVHDDEAVDPTAAGNDVLIATWYGLRQSGQLQHEWQIGFAQNHDDIDIASAFVFGGNTDALRRDVEYLERRADTTEVENVRTYLWDHYRENVYSYQRQKDLTIAIFDAGTKFACWIDGSLGFWTDIKNDPLLGAVVPFIRAIGSSGNSSLQWGEWERFKFSVLGPGTAIDGTSLAEISKMIKETVNDAVRPLHQNNNDNQRNRLTVESAETKTDKIRRAVMSKG